MMLLSKAFNRVEKLKKFNLFSSRKMHAADHPGDADTSWKIPDYRIYKVKGIKPLEYVEKELAKKGLKDPWLRNEVWKYTSRPIEEGRKATINWIFVGIKEGLAIAVVFIFLQEMYYKAFGRPPYKYTLPDRLFGHHGPWPLESYCKTH